MIRCLPFISLLLATGALGQSDTEPEHPRRDRAAIEAAVLERFPQADTNKDGKLSVDEFRAFNAARRGQKGGPQVRSNAPEPDFADVAYGDHE